MTQHNNIIVYLYIYYYHNINIIYAGRALAKSLRRVSPRRLYRLRNSVFIAPRIFSFARRKGFNYLLLRLLPSPRVRVYSAIVLLSIVRARGDIRRSSTPIHICIRIYAPNHCAVSTSRKSLGQ